jgi:hypothetical protein
VQIQKNTVLFTILLTSIFIFSASSIALQLTPAQVVDFKYHQPVNFISSENGALVDLVFNYTLSDGESFTVNSINAFDLFPNGIYYDADYSRLVPECVTVNSTVACRVNALTLRTQNNTINISISGTYTNVNGTSDIINITSLKMTIDNSKPEVSFLGTDKCDNGVCYVASGRNNNVKVVMKDERASFEVANVRLKLGTKTFPVDGCAGMTCNVSAKITCADGESVKLSTTTDSKDDTGNKIIVNSTDLKCDASPPQITEHSVASAVGTDTLVLDKNMIFEFNVTDLSSPTLNMVIYADSVLGGNVTGQCTKTSMEGVNFKCTGIVKPEIDQPGQRIFDIKIEDIAGNVAKESLTYDILKTTNETANNWKVASVEQSSNSFSRPNLEFERTLFVRVNLQPLGNTDIVSIKPDGNCYAVEQNKTGLDSDVVGVKLVTSQSTSVYLKIAIRENNDNRYDKLDNLSYKCPISIVSKKGNYYFSNPEIDNFTININLKDDKNVQQLHQAEIDRVTKSVETQTKQITTLDTTLKSVQQICIVCNGVSTANALIGSAETILAATGVGVPAATGLSQVSSGLQTVSYTGICKSMDEICKFATCSSEVQSKATDWMGDKFGGESKLYNAVGYKDMSSSFNPYKSYIVAAATMCAPAMLYHYKVYSGIQCGYLQCITSDYVKYGQDISTCQQDRAYSTCMFFSGGVLDAIPFVSMFRDVSARVGKILKDPVQLVGTATPLACMILKETPALHGPCVSVQEIFTSIKLVTTTVEMVEKMTTAFSTSDPAGKCSDIIANSKLANTQQSQIGYGVTDYNIEKKLTIDSGILSCVGRDCTYVKGNSAQKEEYKIKVTDTEVLYYYGNKRISPSQMYTNNVKDASNTDVKTPSENVNAIQAERNSELAILNSNYNNAVAAGDTNGANLFLTQINAIVDTNNKNAKGSDMTLAQLKTKLDASAKSLSTQSTDETIKRFGLTTEVAAVAATEKAYGLAVKNNQATLENIDKNIADVKELNKLLNKKTLSAAEESELNRLENEVINNQEQISQASNNKDVFTTDKAKEILLSQKYDQNLYNEAENDYFKLKEDYDTSKTDAQGNKLVTSDMMDNAEQKMVSAQVYLDQDKKDVSALVKSVSTDSLKQQKKDINKEISEKKAAYKKALTNENFVKYFGTWNNAAMTAWGNAQAISGLRSILNLQWGLANPDGKMAQVGNFLIEDVSQFEKAWCKATVKPAERLGDTVIMNSAGEDIFKTGAQIGGRKSGLVNDGTKSYYGYWIQGNVVTSKRDGLIVNIVLIDKDGKETNATQKVLGDIQPIMQGVEFSFGRPSPYYFTDAVDYDKVCMVFDGGSLNSFFDNIVGRNTDRICQKLIAE